MEDMIKTLEQEIQTKKEILKALKKQEKQNRVFGETGFGKFYFKTLEAVSKPVACLYHYANENCEDPKAAAARRLTPKANKMLHKAAHTSSIDDGANELAIKIAKLIVKMEELGYPNVATIDVLRSEVERLRSVETKENSELFNKISELVDKEMKHA